jgi:hypothetical protein
LGRGRTNFGVFLAPPKKWFSQIQRIYFFNLKKMANLASFLLWMITNLATSPQKKLFEKNKIKILVEVV